eukprot:TRINITY_DN7159_c0_g1_i2.p1 TRINITY_DN7159_c0_g1~~TRINITY_DN7159_c0_g1_i2.p1  ORF type:complete len:250 (-),score=41.41 TRINITY_DN7159_c0_g1_i2:13-762(-)
MLAMTSNKHLMLWDLRRNTIVQSLDVAEFNVLLIGAKTSKDVYTILGCHQNSAYVFYRCSQQGSEISTQKVLIDPNIIRNPQLVHHSDGRVFIFEQEDEIWHRCLIMDPDTMALEERATSGFCPFRPEKFTLVQWQRYIFLFVGSLEILTLSSVFVLDCDTFHWFAFKMEPAQIYFIPMLCSDTCLFTFDVDSVTRLDLGDIPPIECIEEYNLVQRKLSEHMWWRNSKHLLYLHHKPRKFVARLQDHPQ